MKELAVNADDFGFTRDVNDGIVHAHREGILTSTTLMANGDAFEHAVELAQATPTLDIGCHLTIIGGPRYPASHAHLLLALATGRLCPYQEFAAQVRKILSAGLRPTHLDTHKHTHLAPGVLSAIARVSREFGIPWVRRPFDFDARSVVALAMRVQSPRFTSALQGCRTTDHFVGFDLTGRMGTAEMVSLIRRLPDGFTELMCHPGFCRDELRAAPTRLKESRERELHALVSPEVRSAIEDTGTVLRAFS